MVGEVLGHYRIIKKIGSGGMGEVYRAHDDQLDRDVALKVLPAGTLADEAARKLFRKEALLLAKLNHPSIATIHEFGSHAGLDFLVMELIPGRSLKEILRDGPLAENEVRRLGLQLAEGLAAAHQQGIIHRDLKPANIMIISDGRLKILDFGLAKLMEGTVQDAAQSSSRGNNIPGTLPYMAPEQLRGGPLDMRTDVYAAGAVLYEAATGQRPFPATHAGHLIQSILNESPRRPGEVNPRLSPSLQTILLKALEKSPERRYHSIQELRADLDRLEVKPSKTATATTITLDLSQPPPVEMAHVLFIDVVQFSMMPMDEQRVGLRELNETVKKTNEFVSAMSRNQLMPLPTGDGMALVFFAEPESPLRCALELTRTLKEKPGMKLRMGIHTGPVNRVPDINAARNVVGGGINQAQRVMDCGDAGHILLSKAIADVLMQLRQWTASLHDLGEVEVKHGVQLHLFNFYTEEVGNHNTPAKLRKGKQGVANVKRLMGVRGAPGSLKRQRRGPQVRPAPQVTTSSSRGHTVQITVPAVPRWAWISVLGCVVVAGAIILSVPAIRDVVSSIVLPSVPTPRGIPPLEEGKHVIVLPFDIKGDRDALGYVAEGLEDELSRKLSALPSLHVVSASAAKEQAKKQKIDLNGPAESIGRNFGINLIVQGSIQQAGGWIGIEVVFDRVADSRILTKVRASESAASMNLLDLEDQAYMSILQAVRLRPNSREQSRAARPTNNSEAYNQYLEGRYALSRPAGVLGIQSAIQSYEKAIQQDPRFALAYVGLSDACRAMYRQVNQPSWVHRALESAQQAQKLNDELPEVHLALGDAYRKLGKTQEAIAEFDRAKKLSPNSDLPWLRLGRTYEDAGQQDQAIDAYTKATQLDPYSLINRNELGAGYLGIGEYEKALDQFRSVISLDPSNYFGYMNTGVVHFLQGEYEQSILDFERALQFAPDGARDDANIHSDLGTAYFYMRRYTDSVKENVIAVAISPNDYALVGNLADAYRWSEQKTKAAETYKTAIELARTQIELNPRDSNALGSLALYYAKNGNLLQAEDCIRSARSIDPTSYNLIFYEATVRTIAKQPSPALESLRLAFEKGYSTKLVQFDPEFSSLHSNPNFQKLITEYSTNRNR